MQTRILPPSDDDDNHGDGDDDDDDDDEHPKIQYLSLKHLEIT